jgi:hypothetical protein
MRLLSVIIFSLLTFAVNGQSKPIRSVEVSDTIRFAAIDRPGDLYIQTRTGQIQKFDADGKLLNLYKQKIPTLFDPRDGARLFAYFRELRQYWYLNPSFDVTASYVLDSAFAIDPWLVCSSGDHNLWILDAADWSLQKIDPKKGLALVDESFTTTPDKDPADFTFMREYQGFLFLLDRSEGILIFNSVGKRIRTIAIQDLAAFNFLGEELYYQDGPVLRFFDLFSAETREVALPPHSYSHTPLTLLTDEKLYRIGPLRIDIFRWQPDRR